MATAAEQLAANLNFGSFAKAEELKKRIWFTLGALLVVRLGTYIPVPGVNPPVFALFVEQEKTGVLRIVDHVTGGAVTRMSLFALYLVPFLAGLKLIGWASWVVPSLEALKKEGEQGRKQLYQYVRYVTLASAAFGAYIAALRLETIATDLGPLVNNPGFHFRLIAVVTLATGAMFLMWLSEQITSRGLGDGCYVILITGIAAGLPAGLDRIFEPAFQLGVSVTLFVLATLTSFVTLVVFMERAQRRLLVQYPKRQEGNRIFQGDAASLPLRLNPGGLSPAVAALAILLLPLTVAQYLGGNGPDWLNGVAVAVAPGQALHSPIWVALIVFFVFFEAAVALNPQQVADGLRKYGGFFPGIRPGVKTAAYIDYVLTRTTVIGALYLSALCVLPELLLSRYGIRFSGIYLILTVTVTMGAIASIQGHLLAHQYEGLVKKVKLRGATRQGEGIVASPPPSAGHHLDAGMTSGSPLPLQLYYPDEAGGDQPKTSQKQRVSRIRPRVPKVASRMSAFLNALLVAMCGAALFPSLIFELVRWAGLELD